MHINWFIGGVLQLTWGTFLAFLAWVYQAIERHAVHMTFHPSTDLGLTGIHYGPRPHTHYG